MDRADLWWAGIVVAVGVVVPLAVTWSGGALGLVRNDDWAYSRVLFGWAESGHLELTGWNEMTLLGAFVPAAPVAGTGSVAALQVLTAVLGGVGLVSLYRFARGLVPAALAAGAVVGVAITPLWMPLTVSFMTDVPALAWAAVAAWSVARAGRSTTVARLVAWFSTAMVAAVWSFTIRQSGLVVVAAVIVAAASGLWSNQTPELDRRRAAGWMTLIGVLAVTVIGAFFLWRMSLPNAGAAGVSLRWSSISRPLRNLDRLGLSLGALLLPAVLVVLRPSMLRAAVRRHPVRAGLGGVAIAAVTLRHHVRGSLDEALLTDHLTRFGSYSTTIAGERVPVLPLWVWSLVVCVAALNLWVLFVLAAIAPWRNLARRRPTEAAFLGVIVVGSIASVVAWWALGRPAFDRHLLVVVAFSSVAVVWVGSALLWPAGAHTTGVPQDRRYALMFRSLRVLALGLVALLSGYLGLVSVRFDAARWSAASTAQRELRIDARRIDGGFEWVGAHSVDVVDPDRPAGPTPWSGILSATEMCAVVVQSPERNDELGRLVGHSSVLGVERWFHVSVPDHPPPSCRR